MPPMEYPENMMPFVVLRCLGCAYSIVSAIAVGTTPPSPRPATKRASPNSSGVGAIAASAIAAENQAMQPSMIRRRPTMSVKVPITIAPMSMPSNA